MEHVRRDLEVVVEAAEHEGIVGQVVLCSGLFAAGNDAATVVDLVGIRHVGDFFSVMLSRLGRHHDGVGDEVIDKVGAHGAGVTQIVDLKRGRARRQRLGARAAGVALEVDGDVDLKGVREFGDFLVAVLAYLVKLIEGCANPLAHFVFFVRAKRKCDQLEARFVMLFE